MPRQKRRINEDSKKQMICNYLKNNMHCFLLIAAVLLGVFIIWKAAPLSYNAINNEDNNIFEGVWQYSINGEDFQQTALPDNKKISPDSKITLKNQLPVEMIKGATVLLRTSQQNAEVFVDSVSIYNTCDLEKTSTSAYHFVRLPADCAGKEIRVVLSSSLRNYAGYMNQIYIGSKASNVFFLFRENGFRFIIGFLISSLGLLLMAMFLFTKGKTNKSSIIYLGAFFICAGYWLMVESKMMQFIVSFPMALTNSSIFALTLLPVFSGLYYYKAFLKLYNKLCKYVIIIATVTSFLLSFIACFLPILPLRILPYYGVLMGLYLIIIFTAILIESVKTSRFFSTAVAGIVAFSICCLLELIFYLTDITGYNESNFLTIGLLLFCIATVVDSVQNFARVQQTAVKVDALSILAYTDSLTGLRNRTAFLETVSNVDVDKEGFVSLGMFDVNNLKFVNDTFGHLVGDAMLRHSAKTIKSSLREEDELYRIGGDEFVVILRHDNTLGLSELEKRLADNLEQENQKQLDYQLSIAYGYATFLKDTDKTLFETLARADKGMYACKKMQKDRYVC